MGGSVTMTVEDGKRGPSVRHPIEYEQDFTSSASSDLKDSRSNTTEPVSASKVVRKKNRRKSRPKVQPVAGSSSGLAVEDNSGLSADIVLPVNSFKTRISALYSDTDHSYPSDESVTETMDYQSFESSVFQNTQIHPNIETAESGTKESKSASRSQPTLDLPKSQKKKRIPKTSNKNAANSSTFNIDAEISATLARLSILRSENGLKAAANPPQVIKNNVPKQEFIPRPAGQNAHRKKDLNVPNEIDNATPTQSVKAFHNDIRLDSRQVTPGVRKDQQVLPMSRNRRQDTTVSNRKNNRSSPRVFFDEYVPSGSSRKNTHSSPRVFFDEYLSISQVEDGLAAGTLFKGLLRISKRNNQDSYVTCEGSANDFYIYQQKYRNRSLDGDLVVIELLVGAQLENEIERKNVKSKERNVDNLRRMKKCEVGDDGSDYIHVEEAGVKIEENPGDLQMAKVVFIAESVKDREFTGTIAPPDNAEGHYLFKCRDKRIPFITLRPEYISKEYIDDPLLLETNIFKVSIKKWNASHRCPQGIFHGRVGQIGELPTESRCLLIDNGVVWDETFTDKVTDCLPSIPWTIPESEIATRLDLRGQTIFTIDPLTAKDLDDAVHIRPLHNNTFEVGVHIADVSYFIPSDNALDTEAEFRATTVYLVQKAIPMLPRVLCEDLCSLNPGVDRLAFSVIWKLDSEGRILGEPWFGKTIIRSRAKLSYEHAQTFIEGHTSWDLARKSGKDLKEVSVSDGVKESEIKWTVLELWKLAKQIRATRFGNGALSLQSMKLWFSLDDNGNPAGCGPYVIKEANNLIEEFMLLANMSVAQKILTSYPDFALLRQHSPPKEKTIIEFIRHANILGFSQFKEDELTAGELQSAFDSVADPVQNIVLQLLCVKPMMRAQYFSSGDDKPADYMHHFGLNVEWYTHFTSPIRRYCDLIVHRLLDGSLAGQDKRQLFDYKISKGRGIAEDLVCDMNESADLGHVYSTRRINGIANVCNARKNASKSAQDASQHLFLCTFLSQMYRNGGGLADGSDSDVYETGIVHKVQQRSFDVFVPKYGAEKRVWVEDLVDRDLVDGCVYNETKNSLMIHWKGNDDEDSMNQEVEVFCQIPVRIEVNATRSPPEYKIVAVFPSINNPIVEFVGEVPNMSADLPCLAILDNNN